MKGVKNMEKGDKVRLLKTTKVVHAFPEKYTEPKQIEVLQGSIGTIEETFKSGRGIVRMKKGIRLYISLKKFEKVEGVKS